jgi:hypothetical protein
MYWESKKSTGPMTTDTQRSWRSRAAKSSNARVRSSVKHAPPGRICHEDGHRRDEALQAHPVEHVHAAHILELLWKELRLGKSEARLQARRGNRAEE